MNALVIISVAVLASRTAFGGVLTTNFGVSDAYGNYQSFHAPISKVNTISAPGFIKTIASPSSANTYATRTVSQIPTAIAYAAAPTTTFTYTAPAIQKTFAYSAPATIAYHAPLIERTLSYGAAPAVAYAVPGVQKTISYRGTPVVSVASDAPPVFTINNPGFTKTIQTPYHSIVASNQAIPLARKRIDFHL